MEIGARGLSEMADLFWLEIYKNLLYYKLYEKDNQATGRYIIK